MNKNLHFNKTLMWFIWTFNFEKNSVGNKNKEIVSSWETQKGSFIESPQFYLLFGGGGERDREKTRDSLCFSPFWQFAISGFLSIIAERKDTTYLVSCNSLFISEKVRKIDFRCLEGDMSSSHVLWDKVGMWSFSPNLFVLAITIKI